MLAALMRAGNERLKGREDVQNDEIVTELGNILVELKEQMALLEEVTNPALRPRHWLAILDELGVLGDFCPDEAARRRGAATGQQPVTALTGRGEAV
jgi:hypothetical protein